MTEVEYVALQQAFPDADRVWRDRMFDLDKDKLLNVMVQNMEPKMLHGIFLNVQKDIDESRAEEGETND
tara:strand:+ start:354 stop:560 length:207 start_codon:yes stop_codon:yes gene_type:complete